MTYMLHLSLKACSVISGRLDLELAVATGLLADRVQGCVSSHAATSQCADQYEHTAQ